MEYAADDVNVGYMSCLLFMNSEGTLVNKLDGEIYLHRSLIPLKDINFKAQENPQYSLFDDECSGMCGV